MIVQFLTQRCESFLPDLGHQEERRSDVEAVTLAQNLITAPTWRAFLLQYGDIISIFRKPGSGGNSANSGTNDDRGRFLHVFSSIRFRVIIQDVQYLSRYRPE